MSRLLLISCSATKRQGESLAAVDRYDGPKFRLLRKFVRDGHRLPKTRILSAEYGLIAPNHPVRMYDQIMTPALAELYKRDYHAKHAFGRMVLAADDIFLMCGGLYLEVFESWRPLMPGKTYWQLGEPKPWTVASGAPGERLHQLGLWLRGQS